jgi:HK97 family phage major capsid protein
MDTRAADVIRTNMTRARELRAELAVIDDACTAERRDYTDEERSTIEHHAVEIRECDDRALGMVTMGARGDEIAEGRSRFLDGLETRTTRAGTTPEEALAYRSIESDRYIEDAAKEAATVMVEEDRSGMAARWVSVASNPDYLTVYRSLLVDPERGHLAWTESERAAFNDAQLCARSLNIATPAEGGYMVPFSLDPTFILTNDGTLSPLRSISRRVTIATDKWRGITTAGVTTEWKDESAEVADASPDDLAQPTIPVHMADAYVTYSFEAEQDIPQLISELRLAIGDAKERHEATAFTLGSGTGQPKGIITAVAADSGSIVAPTTAETFAAADVYKVAAALPARHQGNASWLANYVLEYTIRQFATGTGPQHAFWADMAAGTPPQLVGKPYRGCSDMDGTYSAAATAAHNYLLLFGDFAKYMIVDRIGATTEIVPHVMGENGRPTGERGMLVYWRVGADCLDTNAFRLLDIPTTA